MDFEETILKGAYIIKPKQYSDTRGSFERLYCKEEFKKILHSKEILQINHSITLKKGAIRGLHYQVQPDNEIKIIKCLKGKIYDVIVDLRENSSTILNWFGLELSKDNMKMIYIPEGFAHGYQTLVDNCELVYFHTAYYSPLNERGLKYNDPRLNITWPIAEILISEKDNNYSFIDEHFKGV